MKSECRQAHESIQLLLDGRLGGERRAQLDRHVEGCSSCAGALDSYRASDRLVSTWIRPTAGDDPGVSFDDRLLRQLREEPVSTGAARPQRIGYALAGMTAALAAVWIAHDTHIAGATSAAASAASAISGCMPAQWADLPGSFAGSLDAFRSVRIDVALPEWTVYAGVAALIANGWFAGLARAQRGRQRA